MRPHRCIELSVLSTIAASFLVFTIIQPMAFAQGGPARVTGGGEATAAAFVTYVGHDGVNRDIPSINTIGHRITFGFNATKNNAGVVRGQMQVVDHTSGMIINSDVTELLIPHPTHAAPLGSTGLSFRMASSTAGVRVDGRGLPGWRFVNSPGFDGDEGALSTGDTICFELFDAAGVRILQWSAFVDAGNVQVVECPVADCRE